MQYEYAYMNSLLYRTGQPEVGRARDLLMAYKGEQEAGNDSILC